MIQPRKEWQTQLCGLYQKFQVLFIFLIVTDFGDTINKWGFSIVLKGRTLMYVSPYNIWRWGEPLLSPSPKFVIITENSGELFGIQYFQ